MRRGARRGSLRNSLRFLRGITIAAVAGLMASTLAGCGDSGKGGTLDVWVYEDASTVVQKKFVKEFNRTSDVDINLVLIEGGEYQERMRSALDDPNPADIFFNWGGGNIVDFVGEGRLMDLTEVLMRDQHFENSFPPHLLEGAMIGGRYYGIPMRGVQPVILFYNKSLFDKIGVEPPETFDDLLDLVDTFNAEGIAPVSLAGGEPWTELMWLEYLLDRYGGANVFRRIQDGDVAAWGDPAVRWAAQTVRDLVEAGTFAEGFESMEYTDHSASKLFADGKAAMHLMGSWEYSNQLARFPGFATSDLAYTTFPVIEGGEGEPGSLVGSPSNYWSVNASLQEEGQEHRLEAAIEFLKLSADESYARALIENGDVPTTHNASVLIDHHANPEYARFQYEMVIEAPSFQLSWDQALPVRQTGPMMTAIKDLFSGKISADGFVDAMLQNE